MKSREREEQKGKKKKRKGKIGKEACGHDMAAPGTYPRYSQETCQVTTGTWYRKLVPVIARWESHILDQRMRKIDHYLHWVRSSLNMNISHPIFPFSILLQFFFLIFLFASLHFLHPFSRNRQHHTFPSSYYYWLTIEGAGQPWLKLGLPTHPAQPSIRASIHPFSNPRESAGFRCDGGGCRLTPA